MFFFNIDTTKDSNKNSLFLTCKKLKKKSNGSNNIVRLSSKYSFQYKFKKLLVRSKWLAGRCSKSGRITVFSKGSRKKNRIPLTNYSFRYSSIYFIGGLNFSNSFRIKIVSIVFTSNGSVFFKPLSVSDSLFSLVKLKSLFFLKIHFFIELCY